MGRHGAAKLALIELGAIGGKIVFSVESSVAQKFKRAAMQSIRPDLVTTFTIPPL